MKHQHALLYYHNLRIGWKYFWKQIFKLFTSPIFWVLTLVGNSLMFAGACVFYIFEKAPQGQVKSFLDALWWAMSTVTTVGYGAITPQTAAGKILDMMLMLSGTAVFAGFTGLFASALIAPEMAGLDKELQELKHKFKSFQKNSTLIKKDHV